MYGATLSSGIVQERGVYDGYGGTRAVRVYRTAFSFRIGRIDDIIGKQGARNNEDATSISNTSST